MSDETKVLLTFENGDIIVAKRFGYAYGDVMGIVAACDDGSKRSFFVSAEPTNAELYGIKIAANAGYEEARKALEPILEELEDRGVEMPDTSTLQRIDEWLKAEAQMDENQMEDWGGSVSQYSPGFAIFEALTFEEHDALGLRTCDLGGPASSVPCVSTTASLEDLNKVLAAKKLPFVFIDEDGPEEDMD